MSGLEALIGDATFLCRVIVLAWVEWERGMRLEADRDRRRVIVSVVFVRLF